MGERSLYSIEAVAAALSAAADAGSSAGIPEIIRAHLASLTHLLQIQCGVFYPSDGSSPVRSAASGRRELRLPEAIEKATHSFVAEQDCIMTSHDPVFALEHLRHMPALGIAFSAWFAVIAGETVGTMALFDGDSRSLSPEEEAIIWLFLQQLIAMAVAAERPKAGPAPPELRIEPGSVLGIISKELINPLTAMLGYIELMREENQTEKSTHYIDKLRQQTEKVQQVIMAWHHASAPVAAAAMSAATSNRTSVPQPMAEQVDPPRKLKASRAAKPPAVVKRARVLIVQKNESALDFERNVMSAMSTDVVATFTGEDAIALLQTEDISAVIVDDELDGEWPGRKLYGWICENRPDLRERFMLTVSTTPKAEVKELIEEEKLAYVQKPLRTVELFAGVQQLLTGKTNRQIN